MLVWKPSYKIDNLDRGSTLQLVIYILSLSDYSSLTSKDDRMRLAILAELCGCYEEARELYKSLGESIHMMRNELWVLYNEENWVFVYISSIHVKYWEDYTWDR